MRDPCAPPPGTHRLCLTLLPALHLLLLLQPPPLPLPLLLRSRSSSCPYLLLCLTELRRARRRWGRAQEVPGEDPKLTAEYAAHFIAGAQRGTL
jgi:hypothetical protein